MPGGRLALVSGCRFAGFAGFGGFPAEFPESLVRADDHRGDDEHEDVFFDGDAEQFDAGSHGDLEDADPQCVPVPQERGGVEDGGRAGGGPERPGVVQECEGDTPPEDLGHEVGVRAEDSDVGKHVREVGLVRLQCLAQ